MARSHAEPDTRAAGGNHQPSPLQNKQLRPRWGTKSGLEPAASWEPGGRGCTPALAAPCGQFPSPSLFSLIAQRGLPGTACFSPGAGTKLRGAGLGRADPGTGNATSEEGFNRFGLPWGAMRAAAAMVTLLPSALLRGGVGGSVLLPGERCPRGGAGGVTPSPATPAGGIPEPPGADGSVGGHAASSWSRVPAGVPADSTPFLEPFGQGIGFSRWARVRALRSLRLQPFPCLRRGRFTYERARGGKVELQRRRQSLNIIFSA